MPDKNETNTNINYIYISICKIYIHILFSMYNSHNIDDKKHFNGSSYGMTGYMIRWFTFFGNKLIKGQRHRFETWDEDQGTHVVDGWLFKSNKIDAYEILFEMQKISNNHELKYLDKLKEITYADFKLVEYKKDNLNTYETIHVNNYTLKEAFEYARTQKSKIYNQNKLNVEWEKKKVPELISEVKTYGGLIDPASKGLTDDKRKKTQLIKQLNQLIKPIMGFTFKQTDSYAINNKVMVWFKSSESNTNAGKKSVNANTWTAYTFRTGKYDYTKNSYSFNDYIKRLKSGCKKNITSKIVKEYGITLSFLTYFIRNLKVMSSEKKLLDAKNNCLNANYDRGGENDNYKINTDVEKKKQISSCNWVNDYTSYRAPNLVNQEALSGYKFRVLTDGIRNKNVKFYYNKDRLDPAAGLYAGCDDCAAPHRTTADYKKLAKEQAEENKKKTGWDKFTGEFWDDFADETGIHGTPDVYIAAGKVGDTLADIFVVMRGPNKNNYNNVWPRKPNAPNDYAESAPYLLNDKTLGRCENAEKTQKWSSDFWNPFTSGEDRRRWCMYGANGAGAAICDVIEYSLSILLIFCPVKGLGTMGKAGGRLARMGFRAGKVAGEFGVSAAREFAEKELTRGILLDGNKNFSKKEIEELFKSEGIKESLIDEIATSTIKSGATVGKQDLAQIAVERATEEGTVSESRNTVIDRLFNDFENFADADDSGAWVYQSLNENSRQNN